jgi:transcriptional regulator with XRE-family HTH domain
MSRQELAEAVAAYLYARHGLQASIDDGYIGKLERGEHRWPTARYREALCEVLGVADASALGFYIIRGLRAQPSALLIRGFGVRFPGGARARGDLGTSAGSSRP